MKSRSLMIKFMGCCALLATTGCFSALSHDLIESQPSQYSKLLKKDTIVAIAEAESATIGHSDKGKTLVFIGENSSYVLVKGRDALVNISKIAKGAELDLSKNDNSKNLFIKDKTIWGSLFLVYRPTHLLSEAEKTSVLAAGFTQKSEGKAEANRYEAEIAVEGFVYSKINVPESKVNSFTAKRTISFYAPPRDCIVPKIEKTILYPIAFAADVVTSPLQFLGFLYLFRNY